MGAPALLEAVEIETGPAPEAAVIWLHGLGADGNDFAPIVPELELPAGLAVRFVLPHAPPRPVTVNGGAVMRAWYDVLDRDGARGEDEAGVRASQAQVEALIEHETGRGIPARRIVLAGFSQGGAIALQTGLRHPVRLAGVIGLSCYLPLARTLAAEAAPANRAGPIFLAHGGDCPLPRRVAEAVSAYTHDSSIGDQEKCVYPAVLDEGRKLASQLLNSQPDEVAFVGPTSLALSFIASGLKVRKSANILIYFDDYPSNVYPWLAMAEQGVEVRMLNTRGLGIIRVKDVIGQIDENTRMVALASCHFISGYRIDCQAIGEALRKRNILFCLDAIQTVGAFPTTTENVDMLAADAHKWLLGPCGAGLMYVRRSVQERLTPPIYGWHNVRCPNYVAQEQIVFRNGSQKYEAGTHNLLGIVGLVAAMELILELGVENITRELLRRGYSEADIERILGGNMLRVMERQR